MKSVYQFLCRARLVAQVLAVIGAITVVNTVHRLVRNITTTIERLQ